ncbi:TonB-dependent receptor [Sphingomonas cavernae]|uniref:TonB-dependent receptor n=1 Tax=Sphingomonas cavernae TaxID=2320861 RepID=A0A418WJQ9_9SPHN|nr:TonB-dependent receptor [Sphingomonas cavernae]RJF90248.1 TonB-dependent receptor [Sphingomonas cavernae]
MTRPYDPANPIIPIPPFPRNDRVTFQDFLPSATLEYKASNDAFFYLSYSEGFKRGGYNFGAIQPPFRPEKIKSYEAGARLSWFDRRLTTNLTAFHYDYSEIQVSQVRGQTTTIENAAAAKINGIEFEATLRTGSDFRLGFSATYLDSKFADFISIDPAFPGLGPQDLDGNRLTQAPKWSFNASVEKGWELGHGRFSLGGEYNYVSKQFFTPFNSDRVAQKGYGLASARARYGDEDGWYVEAYVRNIGNEFAFAQSYVSSTLFGPPVLGVLIEPRTYGVKVGFEF